MLLKAELSKGLDAFTAAKFQAPELTHATINTEFESV